LKPEDLYGYIKMYSEMRDIMGKLMEYMEGRGIDP